MYREIPTRDSPTASPNHPAVVHTPDGRWRNSRSPELSATRTSSTASASSLFAFSKSRSSTRDHKYHRVSRSDGLHEDKDGENPTTQISEGDYVDIRLNGGKSPRSANGNSPHSRKLPVEDGVIYAIVSNGIGEGGKSRVSRYYDDDEEEDVDNYIHEYKGNRANRTSSRRSARNDHERQPTNNNSDDFRNKANNQSDDFTNVHKSGPDKRISKTEKVRNGDIPDSHRIEDKEDLEGSRREEDPRSRSASTDDSQSDSRNFLGSATQSAWLRWSHERRASYRRKVEFIEQRQNELEKIRISSPVRKARKESVRFVAPELEERHLTVDSDLDAAAAGLTGPTEQGGLFEGHAAFPFDIPLSSRRKSMAYDWSGAGGPIRSPDGKMTLSQWNALIAFWENKTFVRSRYVGVALSLLAILVNVIGLSLDTWTTYDCGEATGIMRMSLWKICDVPHHNCTSLDHDKWEISVIGILMFCMTFGSTAVALSICGIFSASLPKKIYYHHSAGEIHLICALGCSATLLLYPLTVRLDAAAQRLLSQNLWEDLPSCKRTSFGPGYFITAVAAACFSLASLCLCLDDVIRAVADGCGLKRLCRRGGDTDSSSNKVGQNGNGKLLRLFGEER